MKEQKMSFSKLVFGESVVQGCQMIEFNSQIQIVLIFYK
jgi:hypothetical protein